MAALLGYATSLFRRGKADGVPGRLKSVTIPLYFRQPSGLALFAPAIIAIDALVIASTVDVTWRNWKYPPKTSSNEDSEPRALRPLWMRLGVCSMEIFTGAAIAISLLYYRSRMVTMLSILPPKNPNAPATALNRRIFVQSAGNWRANGTIFPLSACKLTRVEEKVMLLQITGQEGGWQLNLRHSAIDGVPATSVEQACKTFGAHWRGAGGKGTILTT